MNQLAETLVFTEFGDIPELGFTPTAFLYEFSNTLPKVWGTLSAERRQVLMDGAYKLADFDQKKGSHTLSNCHPLDSVAIASLEG